MDLPWNDTEKICMPLRKDDTHKSRRVVLFFLSGGADAAVSFVSVDTLGTRTLCGLASWSLGPRP